MHSPPLQLDDLKYFLAVARHGRLVTAAERLGVEHSTVSRRVHGLEKALGVRLFEKTQSGWILAEAGARLLPHATEIEELAQRAQADASGSDAQVRGAVRVLANEGVGAYLTPPLLVELQQQVPRVGFEVVTTSQVLSFRTGEFDIAITIHRPDSDLVISQKLADYSLRLYASSEYLSRHPRIETPEQLDGHWMVWYIESLVGFPELRFFEEIVGEPQFAFRSSSLVAQHQAVAAGAGIGLLPCYVADLDSRLLPVLHSDVTVRRTYWLVIPKAVGRARRVSLTAQFLLKKFAAMTDRLEPDPR